MFKWNALIIICFVTFNAHSQPLSAFHDYRGCFMVFDKGIVKELEHLPVKSFQVGGKCIPFVSHSGQFKVYYDGNVKTLADQFVSKYYTSPNLMVYQLYNQLYVFDNGNVHMLSGNVKNYAASDSLVAYFNENTYSTHIYYKDSIFDIESSLVGTPVIEFKAGDNLIAYYNKNTKYLKAFYHGKVWNILHSLSRIDFIAGRDILAYVDYAKNSFHLFYKGKMIDLEDYKPKSFKIGDDLMAYVDNLDGFKIFYDDEIHQISTFEPDFYEVKDSLVVFAEQGNLKVFYKGEVSEYGYFIPKDIQAKESTLAFIGPNGWLEAFTNGEFIEVTNDLITSYSVDYNVICINTTLKKIKIFSHGKTYDTN
jgi:hypothetical protein